MLYRTLWRASRALLRGNQVHPSRWIVYSASCSGNSEGHCWRCVTILRAIFGRYFGGVLEGLLEGRAITIQPIANIKTYTIQYHATKQTISRSRNPKRNLIDMFPTVSLCLEWFEVPIAIFLLSRSAYAFFLLFPIRMNAKEIHHVHIVLLGVNFFENSVQQRTIAINSWQGSTQVDNSIWPFFA